MLISQWTYYLNLNPYSVLFLPKGMIKKSVIPVQPEYGSLLLFFPSKDQESRVCSQQVICRLVSVGFGG